MPAPAALSAKKRKAILDSARENFAVHGFDGASMSEISRVAGVSKTTVYYHYKSKAELFGAFIERECAGMLAQNFDPVQVKEDGGSGTLRTIGLGMIHFITSPVCLMIDRVVTSEAETFPELAEAFYASGPQQAITRLAGWLEQQTRDGVLAVPDSDFAADQFFTLIQTGIYYRARLRLGHRARKTAADVVDEAVTMFLARYEAPLQPRRIKGR